MTKSGEIGLGVLPFLPFLLLLLYFLLFSETFFYGFAEMERTHDNGLEFMVSGIWVTVLCLSCGTLTSWITGLLYTSRV